MDKLIISIIGYDYNGINKFDKIFEFYHLDKFAYFTRNHIKTGCDVVSKTLLERINKNETCSILIDNNDMFKDYMIHLQITNNTAIAIIATKEYSYRMILELRNEIIKEWLIFNTNKKISNNFAIGTELINKYNNPNENDKITKIQNQLDNVKGIMVKNISDLLNRGEKIEDLLAKSEDLKTTSIDVWIKSKKLNSCCIIL